MWYVVWDRNDRPVYCFTGYCAESALNPIYGNTTGPYTQEEAERIMSEE